MSLSSKHVKKGCGPTIITVDNMVSGALEVAETLAKEGIGTRVINLATIKPIIVRHSMMVTFRTTY